MPTTCPSCGSDVVKDPDGVAIRCVSAECPKQLRERIAHWVSRKALDIDGFGSELINVMIDSNLIHDVADIYKLSEGAIASQSRGRQNVEMILSLICSSPKEYPQIIKMESSCLIKLVNLSPNAV